MWSRAFEGGGLSAVPSSTTLIRYSTFLPFRGGSCTLESIAVRTSFEGVCLFEG